MNDLTPLDISILKYYKQGRELCGFEGLHNNLCNLGYLDDDLQLSYKGNTFVEEFKDWDSITAFDNDMYISVKIKL